MQIKQAAAQLDIGYENARAIVHILRRKGRMAKVPHDIRSMVRRNNLA